MKHIPSIAVIVALIMFVAVGFRVLGVDAPYHQDEYKWALIVAKNSPQKGGITHPPLDELSYVTADRLFGNKNLRVFPLIFFVLDALLLFYFAFTRYGKKTALWALILYCISFYSVLASLMVDTDGQVLPFLFLLLLIVHDRWKQPQSKKLLWIILFLAIATTGMLVKFSFGLGIAAILVDVLITERHRVTKRTLAIGAAALGGVVLLGTLAIYISSFFGFDIFYAARYWKNFFDITDRNFLQIIVQCAKIVMYLSPLLLFPLLLTNKELFKEARPFYLFIAFGIIFYLVLFDFSVAALDRYFQFAIIPLCIITALILSKIDLTRLKHLPVWSLVVGAGICTFLLATLLIPHAVPPLYPKTEWISRVVSLEWNFLYPFTGGSGPLGFYMSFLFIALMFIISLACILSMRKNNATAVWSATVFVAIGLLYNGAMAEEYVVGKIYGNAQEVMEPALTYIKNNPAITEVINYNDIGTYELRAMSKQKQRLYVAPQFSESATEALQTHKGYFLVIDVPHIDESGMFGQHFATCEKAFEKVSEKIAGTVYDCSKEK